MRCFKVGLVWVLAIITAAGLTLSPALAKRSPNRDHVQTQPAEKTAADAAAPISYDYSHLAKAKDLPAALMSLSRHGLDGDAYLLAFDALNMDDKAAQNDFMRTLLLDLRYGAARKHSDIKFDEAALHEQVKACGGTTAECFQLVAARHPQYVMLQTMLDHYRNLAKVSGSVVIPEGKALKRGDHDARTALIRQRLIAEGDLTAHEILPLNEEYNATLEAAMKRFQARHGLNADGVVGKETTQTLNIPASKRSEQIALSLERLRQLPDAPSTPYVLVNLPSYELAAYENGKQVLKMEVVVGQTSRPTPQFTNHITVVGINPTWTPTSTILNKDLLPKFRKNPNYAANGGYVITDRATGARLDPHQVDWYSVSAGDVAVMQQSGESNALGKVKFLLPDNQSIYLHDTSHPELFAKAKRALSSGCIRLKDPKAMLDFVIRAQKSADFVKLQEYYDSKSRKDVRLDQPVLVQTTYFTAWVNEAGEMRFYEDIYRKDDGLQLALNKFNDQFAAR